MEGQLWRASLEVDGHRFQVAVKEIHQRNVSSLSEWLQRWERQAELLRSLDHPGLIRVREVFQGAPAHAPGSVSDGERSLFLVMNWASGVRLDEWVAGHDQGERLAVLGQVAAAVDHLHSGGDTSGVAVLHRDIKPQNIVIDDAGRPRLVDFGFARLADGADYTVVGSLNYMAPEIPQGAVPTPAADRYSFGCVAYNVLSDRKVDQTDPAEIEATVESLRRDGVPAVLCDHLVGLLSARPAQRPVDLAPWCPSASSAPPASSGSSASSASAPSATVVRGNGWVPPPDGSRSLPSTLPPGSPLPVATTRSTSVLGSWPPVPSGSMVPDFPQASLPLRGQTTLTPAVRRRSERQWPTMLGVGLIIAAALIGVVAAGLWWAARPVTTELARTATTTTSAPATTSTVAVAVPAVAGRDRRDVEALLAQQGFAVRSAYVEDDAASETVLAVDPPVGTPLQPGTEVRLTVASPTFTMPDLRGLTLAVARSELTARGLIPAYLAIDPSSADGSALVVAQSPTAGLAQPKDRSVTLSVATSRVVAPTTTTTMPAPSLVLAPPTSAP